MKFKDQQSIINFREILDKQYNWPSLYLFKFIVPVEQKSEVVTLFSNHQIHEKKSSKGRYVSISFKALAESSDFIVNYYKKAHLIKGIIAL